MATKISCGISCVRFNSTSNEYEVLLVKKRYTYAFIEFVLLKFNVNNKLFIINLFNNMTEEEKRLILSMEYGMLYYHAFLRRESDLDKYERNFFMKNKKIFLINFTKELLLDLMANTISIELLWEFPKGKNEVNESNLNCAIREFEEETGITKAKYNIMPSIQPVECKFSDNNINYKYYLYVAFCSSDFNRRFKPCIYTEISNIKWYSAKIAKYLLPNYLNSVIKTIIKKIKKNKKCLNINYRKSPKDLSPKMLSQVRFKSLPILSPVIL